MPRLKSSVPRYCKHKSSGQAVVRLGTRDVFLGPYGSARSRAEYDRVLAEWIAGGRKLPPTAKPEGCTVVEACAAYLKHAKTYYPKIEHRVIKAIQVLKPLYGRTPANDFGPLALKACRQKMIADGRARSYINRIVGQIKLIFKWAASEEMVSHEVPLKLATVAGLAMGRSEALETEPIKPVADDVVDATLPFLPPIVQAMVRLQRLTGVRPAEVCLMRPMDIDRTSEVWVYTPATHKNEWRGKKRQVAIGPKGQEVLRPYLLRDAKSYCFVPAETVEQLQRSKRQSRKTKVQPSQVDRSKSAPKRKPGKRYDTASYRRAVHRACAKAGVEQRSEFTLRPIGSLQKRVEYNP